MAGVDSGTGVDGSTFTHYVYPGIYQNQVCTVHASFLLFALADWYGRTSITVDSSQMMISLTMITPLRFTPANSIT